MKKTSQIYIAFLISSCGTSEGVFTETSLVSNADTEVVKQEQQPEVFSDPEAEIIVNRQ